LRSLFGHMFAAFTRIDSPSRLRWCLPAVVTR
jgi:hypothetical protein